MKKHVTISGFAKKSIIFILFAFLFFNIFSQTTYTWIGANGADWTVSTNWSPNRTTPANTDILQFNNGGTYDVSNVPTESISRLLVTNNTNVSLQSTGDKTLTIRGVTATVNFLIEAGSVLQISSTGTNRLGITYNNVSGQLGSIYGQFIINPNDAKTNWYTTTYSTTITSVYSGAKIINNGGVITGATTRLQFLSGSEYQHNMDGGVIPTASWDANSLVNVTGIVSNNVTGFGQTFGHLTFNNTLQTSNSTIITTAAHLYCNGNFTVKSTGSSTLTLSSRNGYCLYANADFIIENGTLNLNNTGSYIAYIDIDGNYNQTGGIVQRGTSTGVQTIRFTNSSSNKTYTQSGGTLNTTGINLEVYTNAILTLNDNISIASGQTFTNNGTLYCGTKIISGAGNFSNNNGANSFLGIGDANGITTSPTLSGNIQVTGTRTFGNCNYIYNGSVAQVTGNALPAYIQTLKIDNPSGVSLTTNITSVATSLILNNGLLNLGNQNITLATAATVTGNPLSATNMVVADGTGQFIKYFPAGSSPAFTFPIGDNTGIAEYSPVSIGINSNNAAGTIGVRLVDAVHPNNGSAINYLSRYYVFTTTFTSYNYSMSFNYNASDVNGLESAMYYSRYDGSTWTPFQSSVGANNVNVTSVLTETNAPLTATNSYTAREGEFNYYRSVQTGDWSLISTWEVSSDSLFISPAPVPATVAPSATNSLKVTVRAGHNVTISGSDLNTTINELDVYGDLTNTTTGTNINFLSGNVSFKSGSNYYHNRNGGRIPTAVWENNSVCYINGITTTNPTYAGIFNPANLVWNTSGQTSAGYISGSTAVNISQNLTINSGTLNIYNLNYSISGNFVNNGVLNSASGGTIIMNGSAVQTISGTGIWTTGTNGRLYALTINNSAGVNLNCDFAIQTNLTLTNGSLSGTGLLIFGVGGGTLSCYRTNGNINNALNCSYNLSGVTYNVYYNSASSSQTTGKELPPSTYLNYKAGTVTVNNPTTNGGVILNDNTKINNLTVSANAKFDLNGKTVELYGTSLSNSGLIDASNVNSTISFIGASNATMSGTMAANYSNNYISNLIINNISGVNYNSPIQIGSATQNGVLSLLNGYFENYSNNFVIYGSVNTTNGKLNKSGGELRFRGSAGNAGSLNFYNGSATCSVFEMDVTGANPEITLNGNLTITSNFTLTSGVVKMGGNWVYYSVTTTTPMLIANQNSSSYFKFNGSSSGLKWYMSGVPAGTYRFPIGPTNVSEWRPITIQTTVAAAGTTTVMLGYSDLIAGTAYSSSDILASGNIRSNYIANLSLQGSIGTPNITMEYQNSDFNVAPTAGNVQLWYYAFGSPNSCWTTTGAQSSNGTNGANITITKNSALALTTSGLYPLNLAETNRQSIDGLCNSATYTWDGSTNTVWENNTNWTPDPGAGNYPGYNGGLDLRNVNVIIPQVTNQPTIATTSTPFITDITLNSGAILTLAGNAALTVAGDFINNNYANLSSITYSSTGSSVIYTGTSKIVAPGLYYNLDISGSTTPVLSPNGKIRVNNIFTPGLAVSTNTNSTFRFNLNGAQNVPAFNYYNLELNTGVKTATGNVIVNGNLTIGGTIADGGFTITVNKNIYNNGTHSGAGSIILTSGSSVHELYGTGSYTNLTLNDALGANILNSFTINGILNLQNGVLKLGNSTTTTLFGTVTRTAGFLSGYSNTSNLSVTGSGNLGTLYFETGNENLFNFNVNRNTSGELTLGTNLKVDGTLTLSNGLIKIANNDLTIGANASISGGSVNAMIVADGAVGTGFLKKIFLNNVVSTFTFPVGDITGTNEFSSFIITNFKPVGADRTIGIKVTDAKHPQMDFGQVQANYLTRYWTFSDDNAGSSYSYSAMTMNYPAADQTGSITTSTVQFNRWNGSAWNYLVQISSASSTQAVTVSTSQYTDLTEPLDGNDYTLRLSAPVYTWNGSIDSDWQKAGNWTPVRSIPAAGDILQFTDGGTYTVTNVPNQTIGTIRVYNNTNVTLQSSGNTTLYINGFAGNNNVDITAGANLQIGSGTNTLYIAFSTTSGQLANISGTLTVNQSGTFRSDIATTTVNVAALTGNIILNGNGAYSASNTVTTVSGSFTRNTGSTGTVTSTAANLIFSNGSFYYHKTNGSSIPTASYNSGSTVDVTGITSTNLSGFTGTFGNLIWNNTAQTSTGDVNGSITINGNLQILAGKIRTSSTYQITGNNTNVFEMSAGTTLELTNTGTDPFPTNFTTANISLNPTSTIIYGTYAAQNVSAVPSAYGHLIIAGGNTKTCLGNILVAGNLTLSAGTLADAGFTATVNGNVTNNATHSGTGKILLSGGSSQHLITGTTQIFGNVELDDVLGVDLSSTSTSTFNGNLTITNGTFNINTVAATFSSNATTSIASGSTLNINNSNGTKNFNNIVNNGTWNNVANEDVRIDGNIEHNGTAFTSGTGLYSLYGVTKTISGTASLNIDRMTIYSPADYTNSNSDFAVGTLTINSGATLRLTTGVEILTSFAQNGSLYCGTALVTGAGTFNLLSASYTHLYIGHTEGISSTGNMTGNIQVTGTRTYGTSANYYYYGTATQITGNGLTQAYNLTINNSTGVSLTQNVTVSNILYLTDGIFDLENANLRLTNTNNAAAINGTITTSNMIVTNGTGQLIKYFGTNSTVPFTFPVGDNVGITELTPAYLTFSSNSAGDVGVNLQDAAHPLITSYSDFISRYWTFSSTMSSYNYQLNYDYIEPDDVNGNISNILAVRNTTGVWTSYPSTVGGGNIAISTSPLTTITCPLNGSVFSGAGQEILCEENNGFLYERFLTSSMPTGWSVGYIQGTNNWKIQNTPGLSSASGGYYAVFDDWALGSGVTPNEAWIKSPDVYFCNLSSIYLSYYEYWYGVENTYGYVEISADGGNTWTVVNTNSEITVGSLAAPVKTVIDLTPYLTGYSTVMVRFRYKEEAAVGRYWYIDDINIFAGNDVGVSKLVNPPYLDCSTKTSYTNSEQVTIRVYNFSFEDVTNIDWTCDISGGYTGSFSGTVAAIPSNSYVDVDVATIDMSADDVYHFILNASPQAPDIDGNSTNNTLLEGRRQLVQTYPYSENFNTSRAGWRQEGPDHQEPNTAIPNHHGREFKYGELPYLGGPEGEGNSWYVKTINLGACDYIWLESPTFDFSTLNNPVLSMDIKYQFGAYYSQFHVEYSINNGANWYQIGSSSEPDWYEGNANWWYDNLSAPVTDWTHVEHQLCLLSGEPCVKFRISGYAYYGISGYTDYRYYNYFAVDNFAVSDGVPDDIEPIALTLNSSGTCTSYTNAETMQVLINNNTCRPLYNVPVSIQVDGGAVINEIMPGPIPRNESYLYTFTATADLSAAGTHTIVVTTGLPTDGDPSNDTLTETRINDKIVVDGLNPYSEDFNSGNSGWVSRVNSNTDGSRHFRLGEIPYLEGPEGEGESWYVETKTHGDYTFIWAESPVFDLNGASNPILFMDIKYKLNTYYSYFHVEYSCNGGAWTQLGTDADPDWYEGNTNWWYGNYSNPLNDWTTVQHSLCNIVSLTPAEKSCVKFRVSGYAYWGPQADNNNLMPQTNYSDHNYFAFDNFKIIDDAQDVGVIAITEPNTSVSGCLYDQNQTVTIQVYNYGCGDVYNVPVKCLVYLPAGHPDYGSSPYLFTGTVPVATANSTTSYTFPSTFDMTPMGVYDFTSWTEMSGDVNTDNDTAYVSISVDFPKITTYPYLEDFNSNDGYWVAGGQNPPENNGRKFVWGALPYLDGPEGEGNSWYVQTTTSYSYDLIWVESPVFDFSELSNPTLSMDIKYQLGAYYSQFQVRYSTDGGSTWYRIGNSSDPNWYVGSPNWWFNNQTTPVTDWTHVEHDLCELSGEPCVKFQIYGYAYYGPPTYANYSYFAIDNFSIDGGLSDDAEPVAITLNNSGVCGSYSANEPIQVIVNNNLCRPLYNVPVTLNVDGVDIANEIIPGPVPRFGSYMYTFSATADLSAVGNHTITVTTNLATDIDNTNNTHSEIRINNSPIAVSPGNNYEEDFNSGNAGWVSRVNSNTDGTRHFLLGDLPYLNGAEGNGDSWFVETTTHADYTMIGVESPVFDLTNAVDPILKMDIKYQLSTYYSYFHVEYSTNGGSSWTQLGTSADPNWYLGNTNWWYGNYDTPQDTWLSVQRKLCELKGQSCVKFRIYGYAYNGPQQPNNNLVNETDYSNYNYFAFDNFKIIDAQDVGVIAFVEPDPNDVGCLYSANQTVTARVYNWSCTVANNVPITVEITGAATATFTEVVPSIPGGSYVDYTFAGTFDMTPIGTYNFYSYTNLVPDANPNNDAWSMSINVPFPKITTYPYEADFNGDADYWLAFGQDPTFPDLDRGRDFVWGTLPYLDGPEGEGECWYVNTTTDGEYYTIWAESPVFDFTSITEPFLLMDIKYQLVAYYSQFHVEYSLNGGTTWTQLGTSSDPDWYEGSANWWYDNYSNPLSDWKTVFHNLCSFAGQPCVKFRVYGYAYFGPPTYSNYDYFAFDNFRIIDGYEDASVSDFITPVNNEAPCTFDETKEVTIRVKGASCHDLVNVPVYCDITGPYGIVYNLSGTVTIPANTNLLYTFPTTVDLRSVGTYNFTAYTGLAGDDFPSNDTITQSITTLDTLINTFPYYADFNDGNQYWRTGNNNTTNPTRNFVRGQFDYLNGNETNGDAWYVNVTTHGAYDYFWVESPIFDFTELDNPILSFQIKYQLYNYYTQFHVEYSTNGGINWTQLGTDADPDWYVGNTNNWYNNHQNPIDEWTYVEHNLCNLKGQSCVKLRISGYAYYGVSGTTDYRSYNFFAFDNIAITDTDLDAELTSVWGCYGTEYQLEVDVTNRNNFCQLFEPCSYDSQTALKFDGTNDRVDLGSFPALNSFTVESWVYNPVNDGVNYKRIIGVDNNRFEIAKMATGLLYVYLPATGWFNTGRYLSVGDWTHVAVTNDGVQLVVYVNGEIVYTRSGNYSIAASNWFLCSDYTGAQNSNVALDECRIWDIALTADVLRANICGSLLGTESGLIAYYQMEDGTGSSTLTDITGNGHTGTLVNMDVNTCWIVSDLATNNNGVATDPNTITSIDICYDLDGAITCNTYPVNIDADETETIIIPNITIPNGLNLGNNQCVGGTASASHTYSGSAASRAFDSNITTSGWSNTGTMPSWLQYDMGAGNEKIINTYRIYCSSSETPGYVGNENYNPAVWQFQGSNDGTNWDVLDNVYYGNISMNIWKNFYFENTTTYRYYRIYNTYGEGSNGIHITELQMYYVNPEPSSLVVWIENPNGLTDEIPINDTIYVDVSELPHCNDNCVAAIELVNEVTSATSNANATINPLEDPDYTTLPCSGVTLENTSWYYFTTNCRGGEVTVTFDDILCSPGGTGIQVSITRLDAEPECEPANHTEVFCAFPGDESDIIWNPTDLFPDTKYYITIDGVAGNTCDFKILLEGNVSFNPAEAMTGNFIIDDLSAYTTIQQAIDSLEVYGINSPVVFELVDHTFSEQLVLPLICGTSETNTITFTTYCDDCAYATIETNATETENYTVKLNWGQYYVFDRIHFKSLNPDYSRVVEIANRSNNNTFTDCIFEAPLTAGNSLDNSLIFSNITLPAETIHDITFENNTFLNGSSGAYLKGANSTALMSGIEFNNNIFENQSFTGIALINQNAPLLTGNVLTSNSTRTDFNGIYLQTVNNNTQIANNQIYTITASGTGIYFDNVTGISGDNADIYNNMISIGNSASSYGFDIVNTTGNSEFLNFYYNSLNNNSASGSAIRINSANNVNLNNNIFKSASSSSYDVTGTAINENYNDFMPDFAGKGANSITIDPAYLSTTNLHTENPALKSGTTLGITLDIDGETRQNPPYIGADEFLGLVSWTGAVNNDWNLPGNWSSNQVPTLGTTVQIPNSVPNFPEINTNADKLAEVKNLAINSGSHLWVPQSYGLTVYGNLDISGELVLQSTADGVGSASLITLGNINYAGTFTYQQYITGYMWHYMSSPILNASTSIFHPNNFYYYDETVADSWLADNFTGGIMGWTTPTETTLEIMKGYIDYEETHVKQFTGQPNNGNYSYNLSYTDNTATHGNALFDGWNLIGNPYPSYVNWNSDDITKTNVDNGIYFYDDNGTGAYNNYRYYVTASSASPYPSVAANMGTCYIPPAQAFFVKASGTGGSVAVANGARCHGDAPFLKESNEQTDNILRLSINYGDFSDETVIRFLEPATFGYDGEFDAFKLFPAYTNSAQIYSILENQDVGLAISTLPFFNDSLTIIPLGVKVMEEGVHKIIANELNFDEFTDVYLEDLYTETVVNLKTNPEYSFYNPAENQINYKDRFRLIFSLDLTETENIYTDDVLIYSFNNIIVVEFPEIQTNGGTINIYDMSGKKIMIKNYTEVSRVLIPLNSASAFYIVQVITGDNVYKKKVFIIQ